MANHFTLQASQYKLDTKDHEQDADEEQRLVVYRLMRKEVASNDNKHIHHHTQEKCPEAQRGEETQGRTQEGRKK